MSIHRVELAASDLPVSDLALGPPGEEAAARHLIADGLEVIARNWRLASGELRGELDLIARDPRDGTLVVCEVKTRRGADRFGGAVAAVTPRKAAKVRALTAAFLRDAGLSIPAVRLDVVAIDLGDRRMLTHLLDAM